MRPTIRRNAVIASRVARSWLNRTVGGLPAVDVTAAVILSAFAAGLTSGALHPSYQSPNLGIAASAGVLAMTAPVAWRRRMPLAMAGTPAAGGPLQRPVFRAVGRPPRAPPPGLP